MNRELFRFTHPSFCQYGILEMASIYSVRASPLCSCVDFHYDLTNRKQR